jgi:hypothetical protein
VPVFSVVNQNGGTTLGVYAPGSAHDFRKANELQRQRRVQAIAPADYRPGSQAYLWLMTTVDEIAERIVEAKRASFGQRVGRPPSHRPPSRSAGERLFLPGLAPEPVERKPQDRLDPADTLLVPPAVPITSTESPAPDAANGHDVAANSHAAEPPELTGSPASEGS